MNLIKLELYNICLEYVSERIKNSEDAIEAARESSVDDTKSSAGDKYETTREMMQQEMDRHQVQLVESRKLKGILSSIDLNKPTTGKVELGSLVQTTIGTFFIAVSKGQISLDDKIYFAISSASPLGQKLIHQSVGTKFDLNGKQVVIMAID